MKNLRISVITLILACLSFFSQSINSQVPGLINYQAQLTDPVTGKPVADNTYQITFSIYDALNGGNVLWTETHSVLTQKGIYNVLLGSVTPLDQSLFRENPVFLGVKVGEDLEMTPRQQFSSVPYAITSNNSYNLGARPANDYSLASHGHNNIDYNSLTNKPTAGSGITIDASNVISESKYSIGQFAHGGYIFWLDESGKHGLVAAVADAGTYPWANNNVIRNTCTFNSSGIGAGEMNTMLIIAFQYNDYPASAVSFAASACANYNFTSDYIYGDWYLPSLFELQLLYWSGVGGISGAPHWSSSEFPGSMNMAYAVSSGSEAPMDKRSSLLVRPIRRF